MLNTPQEFGALMDGLRQLESRGFAGGGALATLTRTQGSTFRRPGASMLVCGDGTIVRGLSGGCPEADIISRAHEVIGAGAARIVRYDRENGLDALIELGCGGELEVLIEPLQQADDLRFVGAVEQCLAARTPGFLATGYARDGTALLPRPRRLVWSGTSLYDEFGDAGLSAALIEHAGAMANGQRSHVGRFESAEGPLDVLFETLLPPYAAVLVGVNAASLALARVVRGLGWDVTLVDHRGPPPPAAGLAPGIRLLGAGPEQLPLHLSLDRRSIAVVMTHNIERDIEYLRALLPAPLAYIGAIGSRQRARRLLDGCGAAPPRVHAPAGLDIGSETPEEIAVAIAAEILAVTTGHGGASLSAGAGPIH